MKEDTLHKYIIGECSDSENIEIMKWLEQDPDHEKELLSLRKIHNIGIWHKDKEIELSSRKSISKKSSIKKLIWNVSKIAAILFIGIISYTYISTELEQTEVKTNLVKVPIGQQTELTLSDGTKVWLNTRTALSFPEHFSKNNRIVEIDGEAFFDVAKDAKRPFIVKTPKYNIQVLGTIFNVNAYSEDDKFTAALLEGSIELSDKNENKLFKLKPHEMVSDLNGDLEKSTFDDFNQFLWKDGLISFNNDSFKDIVQQLEKYYNVSITINDPKIQNYHITGKFRIKDGIEHILSVIQVNNKFEYKINAQTNHILISQ